MPIYEYQCQACQYEFEKLQKISEPALSECPSCNEPRLRKKISAAGFRLAGSGWYETDFKKSDKQKNLAGEKGAASTGSSGAGESKADTAKSESKSTAPAAKD